jgi:hypothetical protein
LPWVAQPHNALSQTAPRFPYKVHCSRVAVLATTQPTGALGSAPCVRLAFPAVERTRRVSFTHHCAQCWHAVPCMRELDGRAAVERCTCGQSDCHALDKQQFQFTQVTSASPSPTCFCRALPLTRIAACTSICCMRSASFDTC